MTIPLDTATALSPARSAVVKAFAGSIKHWLLVSQSGVPVQTIQTP